MPSCRAARSRPGTGASPPRSLYWNTGREYALLDRGWKLIVDRRVKNKKRLFNIVDDPGETTDLAADHPHQVGRLMAILEKEKALDPQ